MRIVVILAIVQCFFSACSQQRRKQDSIVDSVQSMKDQLRVPSSDSKGVKALRIILSNDSIKLNSNSFDDDSQLLQVIENDFFALYPFRRDSVIAIQLYFSKDLSHELHSKVYKGIENIYNNAWERLSKQVYGKPYKELSQSEAAEIRKEIPYYFNEYELVLYDR